jgi:hypothetical protein
VEDNCYLLLRFYDTYLYYYVHMNLLAFCSGSPAPCTSIACMTITFEYDNDIIVYVLENIISFARDNQYIFLVQCVWWIAAVVGLQSNFVNYIDHLNKQARKKISVNEPGRTNVHSASDTQGLCDCGISRKRRDLAEDQQADMVLDRAE